MRLTTILSISIIIILPFMIFLSAIRFASFNESFYKEEFSKYNVENNVPKALEIHKSVMDFLKGKSSYLPGSFNDREKQHLDDVRRIVSLSKSALYFLIFLFFILVVALLRLKKNVKNNRHIIGKTLLFGGVLTIAIAVLLFLLVNLNFLYSFESFHKLFFQAGTYAFDPDTEIIVNIYHEELFMDLGLKIMKLATYISLIFIVSGAALWLRSKKIK